MPDTKRHHTSARMSQIVEYGDLVILSGQVADDPDADITGQTEQVLASVDRLLAEAGTYKSHILSATIWLSDIRFYAPMNEVWDGWVPAGEAPARTCVETLLAAPEYLVEITIMAGR